MNDNTPMDSEPFDPKPEEPKLEKPMNLQEAYDHLYAPEKFDWEDEAEYAARKVARESFELQLKQQGLTIDHLLQAGHITKPKIQHVRSTPLLDQLLKRI